VRAGLSVAVSLRNYRRPRHPEARQWSGWGTALKPAHEPIIVARKPLCGTVAENVLRHGTGGINVDGCRVGTEVISARKGGFSDSPIYGTGAEGLTFGGHAGRWPANVIHDGSDEVVGLFPETTTNPNTKGEQLYEGTSETTYGKYPARPASGQQGSTGSAARFFYMAKCSRKDRNEGLEGVVNHHPCLKPTALMRYLCRLVTPPGGIVLDPFMGSGSTGKAAILEGFRFIGIEREAEYVEIAKARIGAAEAGAGPLFSQ
jgi:site-specific DNA-methyltransferase (adenine-specific)